MNDFPKYPRFSWDPRSVPWTNEKGNLEYYDSAVNSWEYFHDKLPDSKINKIPSSFRGIILHSHLYRRAKDLCKHFPSSEIESEGGVSKIRQTLDNIKYALSILSNSYSYFQNLCQQREAVAKALATSTHDLQHLWLKSSHMKQKLYPSQFLLSYCFPIAILMQANVFLYSLLRPQKLSKLKTLLIPILSNLSNISLSPIY